MNQNRNTLSKKEQQLLNDIDTIRSKSNIKNDQRIIRSTISRYEQYYYNEGIIPILFEVLESEEYDNNVKESAISVLGAYKDQSEIIIKKIVELLNTKLSDKVKVKLVETLKIFGGKAATTIPVLEKLRNKTSNLSLKFQANETIESLKNPILYPFCPKCGKGSFAYHRIPSTEEIEKAKELYTHIAKYRNLRDNNRPVVLNEPGKKYMFAAIVYCLNCGYIIGPIGGYGK